MQTESRTSDEARTPPTGGMGFVGAVLVNVVVAAVFWLAVKSRHGSSGHGAISYHYEQWLLPVGMFLGVFVVAGVVCWTVVGWRRFGGALIAGAALVAVLDVGWSFVYLVSQGS